MSESDERLADEVIEVERRWVKAHRELDIDAIDKILAEDYMQIRSDGTVIGKEDLLESYRSGKRSWDHADSDQYRLSVYGDAAVLVGRWRGRGMNDGEAFDYSARFMAIYVRRDGDWRLAADQATPLSE